MSDVRPHEHCVHCWYSANKATERFRSETWPDGSPVYPLRFGKGGYIAPPEVKRLREAQADLERVQRQKMGKVTA